VKLIEAPPRYPTIYGNHQIPREASPKWVRKTHVEKNQNAAIETTLARQ
jgi:hypothetical protein